MRVLLLAEECNPEWSSLPSVGYQACRALDEEVDVTLVTHIRNRPALERRGLRRGRIVYIDNEYIAAPLYRFGAFLRGGHSAAWTINIAMYYPSYLAFESLVWQRFAHDLHHGQFDVVHRVTPMSPTLPSPLAQRSPVPFVLGPLNGGLKWPATFRNELAREREWLTHVRGLYRMMPYYHGTYARAAAILAGFGHTFATLPRSALPRAVDFPEVGIDPDLFTGHRKEGFRIEHSESSSLIPEPQTLNPKPPMTFLFVGRLVPLKCVDALIDAFAGSPLLRQQRLQIIGDGMEMAHLRQQVSDQKLESCVEFLGWKSQAEVGQLMAQADVFAFPSIRELGAGVVVEAMASGLACLVVDYGGPGGLIEPGWGVKVPLCPKPQLVEAYRREMEAMVRDPQRVRRLGQAAQEIALNYYSWRAKAKKIVEVYQWVLGQRPDKPVFRPPAPCIPQTARVSP